MTTDESASPHRVTAARLTVTTSVICLPRFSVTVRRSTRDAMLRGDEMGRDATSEVETYPAGRYLEIEELEELLVNMNLTFGMDTSKYKLDKD